MITLLPAALKIKDDDYEEDSESEPEDVAGEDGYPDDENFAAQMAKDEKEDEKEEAAFLKSAEIADFIAREQPDDETRHMTALLSLPADKVWIEEDLEQDKNIKLGLHLLYNLMQGKKFGNRRSSAAERVRQQKKIGNRRRLATEEDRQQKKFGNRRSSVIDMAAVKSEIAFE